MFRSSARWCSGQQPRTKSGHCPADKSVINRLSTAGFVFTGLHRVSFVRPSSDTPKIILFDRLEGTRVGGLLGGPTRRPGMRPARPHLAVPPCAAPSRPARGMSGFWIRQVIPGYAMREKGVQKQSMSLWRAMFTRVGYVRQTVCRFCDVYLCTGSGMIVQPRGTSSVKLQKTA